MSIRTWLTLSATILLVPALSFGQPGGGSTPAGGTGGGRGFGGFGGMSLDPDQFFKSLSGGKDVIVRDQLDQRMQRMFDFMAQSAGITNGQMTREQFREASSQMMARFAGGKGAGRVQGGGGAPGMTIATGIGGGAGDPTGGFGGRGLGGGGFGRGGMPDANGQPLSPEARMEQRAEAMFRRMDKDGDGRLSVEEMGEPLASERDKWDTNMDGYIDLTEFKSYYAARVDTIRTERETDRANSDASEEEIKKPVVYRSSNLPPEMMPWFAEIDTNHDAQISLKEWRESGHDIKLFLAMDHNGDNLVTVEEALLYMRLNKLTAATVLNSARGGFGDFDADSGQRKPLAGFTAPGEFIGSSPAVAANNRNASAPPADGNTPPGLGMFPNFFTSGGQPGNGGQFQRGFDRGGGQNWMGGNGPGGNRGDRGGNGDQNGMSGRRGPGGRGGPGGGRGGFGGGQSGADGSSDGNNSYRGRRGSRGGSGE